MPVTASFKAGMDAAIANPKSNDYDQLIKDQLAAYKSRFGFTPGFPTLDWKLFKALLLVESGGPAGTVWTGKVMQIGNAGDPAYDVLKTGSEHSRLIMDTQLVTDLKTGNIAIANLNIRAAMAYMFTRAVQTTQKLFIDNPALLVHVVKKRESLASIALTESTTIPDLVNCNPKATAGLQPGDKLSFHKSQMGYAISGWLTITPDFLADRYNGGGDPDYADKLNYVLSKLP
jgi:hypothetical protein